MSAAAVTIMADPNVYLEKLSAFSRVLRHEGLTVGPQETADAARLLTEIGFADKALVQTALRTVFAKTREEQLAFDRAFTGFFVSEEVMRKRAEEADRVKHDVSSCSLCDAADSTCA